MSLRFNSSQNLLVRLQPLLLVCAHKLVKVLTLKAHLRHQLSLSRQTHEGFIKLWSMVSYDFTSKPFHRGSGSHPRVSISCLKKKLPSTTYALHSQLDLVPFYYTNWSLVVVHKIHQVYWFGPLVHAFCWFNQALSGWPHYIFDLAITGMYVRSIGAHGIPLFHSTSLLRWIRQVLIKPILTEHGAIRTYSNHNCF